MLYIIPTLRAWLLENLSLDICWTASTSRRHWELYSYLNLLSSWCHAVNKTRMIGMRTWSNILMIKCTWSFFITQILRVPKALVDVKACGRWWSLRTWPGRGGRGRVCWDSWGTRSVGLKTMIPSENIKDLRFLMESSWHHVGVRDGHDWVHGSQSIEWGPAKCGWSQLGKGFAP